MLFRLMILFSPFAFAACDRSSPPPAPAEVARLRVLAGTIGASTEAYGARAALMTSSTACRAARSDHEDRVRPAIEGMVSLGARVDPWMRARGPSDHADVECAAGAMLAELDRHTDIACTAVDLAANRAEAARHVEVLDRWSDLGAARAEEAGAATATSAAGSDGTGPRCVRFSDGDRMYHP